MYLSVGSVSFPFYIHVSTLLYKRQIFTAFFLHGLVILYPGASVEYEILLRQQHVRLAVR